MSIQPGTEWIIREMAEAAESDDPNQWLGLTVSEAQRKTVFNLAVAQTLRLLVGDLKIEDASEHLQEIYHRYQLPATGPGDS